MRPTEETILSIEALVRKSRHYAGVGSRSTPRSTLFLMGEIAAALATYGLTLRSGVAPGADTAFERGCDRAGGKKDIFLPWKGFNGSKSDLFSPSEQAEVIASLCHPNWRACNQSARKFHARNCQQVYGEDMASPVDFIVFWAPEENGIVKGGTATAVFLAREMQISTFNLWDEAIRKQWKEFVNLYERRKRPWKNIFGWIDRRIETGEKADGT